MESAPLEKVGKREADDAAIETEAASAKKQKVEENVCEIKAHTIEIENKVETSSEADEQLIEVKSGVNGNVVKVLEDKSNVLEEDMGAAEKKLVVVLKEGPIATAFKNADDSDSCLQDETKLDANATAIPIKASATLMEEDLSASLKKKDDWSKGPNSFSDDAAFLTEDVTAVELSSPTPSTKISLVSIQNKDDSSTHDLDSARETYEDDIVDTATEKVPVVLREKIEESFSDDERSNGVSAETIASVVTKQEDEINEELESDDETSGSDDDLQTPTTPIERTSGGKTLFVGNLSFSIEQEDVEDFFKAAGEVTIRFAMNSDETFKGYGYVEFVSAEAAEKALRELNGKELLHRRVRLDLVKPRGSFTPYTGSQGTGSFQNGASAQRLIVFVRGFNNSHCQDEIMRSLEEHFGSCGEISRISVPKDQDGCVRGFAYITFKDSGAFSQALALNGSEFKEGLLKVKEARPTCDSRDSDGSGRGYDRNGGRYNLLGFGGRSVGPNFRGRIGWSDFCGRSGWSDSRGRSGVSDFQGRGCGSNFHGINGGSEFRGRHGGSDFRGGGCGSDFRERSGGSDFRGRHGGSDLRGRNFGSDFRGRGFGSDFRGRGFGSDFRGRDFGSDIRGRGCGSDFRGGWSNIHGSGGSGFRGRSGGSEFQGRSDWSDFRGRSGGSDFCGRMGGSNFSESGSSNFRGRSGWSNIHGRGGRSDSSGRSVQDTGIRFGVGVWKHSNGRGVWRDFSGRGILGSFHGTNDVGGTGSGDWFEGGGGGGGRGQGTVIEPTIAAPAPGINTTVISEEGKLKDVKDEMNHRTRFRVAIRWLVYV